MVSSRIWCGVALAAMMFVVSPLRAAYEDVTDGSLESNKTLLYTGGLYFPAPDVVDVDGDGDPDIVVADEFHRLWLFRNDGTSTAPNFTLVSRDFQGLGTPPPSSTTLYNLNVAFGDLDGDGDLDMIGGSHGPTPMTYWRNDGTAGSMSLVPTTTTIALPGRNDLSPALVDIDGDGDLDLYVGSTGGLDFFRNTGSATSPAFSGFAHVLGGSQLNPAFGDLDHDGDYDLLIGKQDGTVAFFRNTGTSAAPTFTLVSSDYLHDPIGLVRQNLVPFLADLDGDHDLDALVARYDGRIEIWMNRGSETSPDFQYSRGLLDAFDANTGRRQVFVDIDNDGDMDFFQGSDIAPNTGNVAFYRNNGAPNAPSWHLETNTLVSGAPSNNLGLFLTPTFVDIDNDGDQDLFAGNWNKAGAPGPLVFCRNDSVGTTITLTYITGNYQGLSPSGWTCPEFADIDGDGDYDLFVGSGAGDGGPTGTIYFYRNDGSASAPSFSLVTTAFAGITLGNSICPTFHDVDGDGDLDLIAGDNTPNSLPNNLKYFENTGAPTSPVFSSTPTSSNFSPIPLYNFNSTRFADLDGDGDDDLLMSDENGGVYFEADTTTHLTVLPHELTVLAGTTVDFNTSETLAATDWSLFRNASGAPAIDPGTGVYTAGTQTGVVDIVQARDPASGMIGRAFVHVIGAADVTAAGKAIIMAGRRPGDPLWPTTNELANFVYRTLRYRGFAREDIYYLNPEPAQDVDGNSFQDDVDAASNLANTEFALTTWAAGSPNLFVYLIDHGEEVGSQAYVRCNETDVLYAPVLDAWLDDLQGSGTNLVTLAVDACQSGGFLTSAHATGTQQRIVIGSADHTQPAFFSGGGLISFTHGFMNAIVAGNKVGPAFRLAAGSMNQYQVAQLDDDGDGIWNPDTDGALADTVSVGASYVAGGDRPLIANASPNQLLTGGGTQATIWASGITSPGAISRVWAAVASPESRPAASLDPSAPVTGLTEIPMTYNAGRYEGTYNGFSSLGTYLVSVYAKDQFDGVSFPKVTYVSQAHSNEHFIDVVGDGAFDSDSPASSCRYLGTVAYDAAKARGLDDAHITFLTSSGETGADHAPSKAELSAGISAQAGASKLCLYLVGSGSAAAFDIDGNGPGSGDMTPVDLDAMLDDLQSAGNTRVAVVLDFVGAGSWLPSLTPPAGKERVVITSSAAGEAAWCEAGGAVSFSRWFFSDVFNGTNFRDAFRHARVALRAITNFRQNPQLDDNASGTSTSADGSLASTTYLGAAFITGAEGPVIGEVPPGIVINSNTGTIWVAQVTSPVGIAAVRGYIVPSTSDPTNGQVVEVSLAYNPGNGRWEYTYGAFNPAETTDVTFIAQDRDGNFSPPVRTVVSASALDDDYDIFYDDDTPSTTRNFFSSDNFEQVHNLAGPADEDWAMFNKDSGRTYTIAVKNQGPNCDAEIAVFQAPDFTSPVYFVDDEAAGGPDEVLSTPLDNIAGTLYIRIRQGSGSTARFGEGTDYILQVFGDWGGNAGIPTIGGTKTRLFDTQPIDIRAGAAGVYSAPQLTANAGAISRPVDVILDDPGDIGAMPHFSYTAAWLHDHPDNGSIVRILASEPVTFDTPATLTLQFLDDGPTLGTFKIDDIPSGSSPADMRVYCWNGSAWIMDPQVPTVSGNTVSIPITSLGFQTIYATAPPLQSATSRAWEAYH